MIDAPVAFAFTAGLVATVNPCGFAMLPAYLSYFVGVDGAKGSSAGGAGPTGGVSRALAIGGIVSSGFIVVFGVAGALVSLGLRSVVDFVPWAALGIGIALTLLGLAMLTLGYEPKASLPKLERGGATRGYGSMFLFGVSYAVASLSCGLPIFLTVVGAATTTTDFLSGTITFLVYGAGMSMLLVVVTLGIALARDGLVRLLRASMPYVGRVSGAVLVVAGSYITAYWVANLRDPLATRGATFSFVESLQQWVQEQLGTRPGFWAAVLGALLGAAVLWARRARSSEAVPSHDQAEVAELGPEDEDEGEAAAARV